LKPIDPNIIAVAVCRVPRGARGLKPDKCTSPDIRGQVASRAGRVD